MMLSTYETREHLMIVTPIDVYLPVNSDLKTGAFLFISSLRPLPKGSYSGTDVVAIDNFDEMPRL